MVIANLAVVVRAVLASRSQVACAMLALDDTRLWLTDNLAQIARASMVAQAKMMSTVGCMAALQSSGRGRLAATASSMSSQGRKS